MWYREQLCFTYPSYYCTRISVSRFSAEIYINVEFLRVYYSCSVSLKHFIIEDLLVKHRKLYTHSNPLRFRECNHSAFTIGRTFLLYFPEANHNERSNKKRKTIGMMIDYNRAIVYDGRMI